MKRLRNHLPSPAMAVAVLALVLALGGTVYAAGTKINGKTVKAKSMPGNRVTPESLPGNRLKPGSVTGKQVDAATLAQVPSAKSAETATSAATATTAANANTLNGHSAGCPGGTQPFAGACWETTARAAATQPLAAQACTAAGGQLPDALDLRAYALTSGVTLDAGDEWSSSINTVTGADAYTGVTVSAAGVVNQDNQIDAKKFRCVLPLLR
ncbi:MAG: hypothetical protein JST31_14815 [Actinobacteria bacterium]|nr:hypothetical protein [Actinomycetota bacterium]